MQGKYRFVAVTAVGALAGAALGATNAVFVGTAGPDVHDQGRRPRPCRRGLWLNAKEKGRYVIRGCEVRV